MKFNLYMMWAFLLLTAVNFWFVFEDFFEDDMGWVTGANALIGALMAWMSRRCWIDYQRDLINQDMKRWTEDKL